MTKVSSTNITHKDGGCGQELRAFTSNSSMNRFAMRGLMGAHGSTLHLFIILTLEEEEEVSIGEAELQ